MNFTNAFDNTGPGNGKPSSGLDAFDATDAAPERKLIPAGMYPARIVSGSFTQTTKGKDGYRIVFEVTEGEQRGNRVSRTWVFTEKAVAYAKRDLAAFGLTDSRKLLEPFPPAGREVYVRLAVAVQRGDDGSEFNDVKKIDVVRTEDSPAKDFLIDPSAAGNGKSEGGTP